MSCEKTCTCECCQGTSAITPKPLYNRPGLDALSYRIGEHGEFLETMKARLASTDFPALAGFGARTPDDPSIAMLDGWATVADVLTFYQERIANEGYLRTATERRSVVELARLIGYEPRPGVASTVYLAYEIDQNAESPVEIPVGSKVQSLPGPGELPQTFETVDKFVARKEWNAISARLERPQNMFRMFFGTDAMPSPHIYVKGITTGLKANDAILIQILDGYPGIYRVAEVLPDSAADRTLVRFRRWNGDEVELPPETQIRRAVLALQKTAPANYPAGSLSRQLLVEVGEFLMWLQAEASRKPIAADVAEVLARQNLMTMILTTVEGVRKAAASAISDKALARGLEPMAKTLETIAPEIEEFTGLDGGGAVGVETNALAARILAIDTTLPRAPKEDARMAALSSRILTSLAAARSVPPRNSQSLERDPANLFDRNSDVGLQAVAALEPALATELSKAVANAQVSTEVPIRVFAMRQKSLLFGSTAPPKVVSVDKTTGVASTEDWADADIDAAEFRSAIHLDLPQEKIREGSWLALDYSAVDTSSAALGGLTLPKLGSDRAMVVRAGDVNSKLARAAYSFNGQTSRIALLDTAGKNPMDWFGYTALVDNNEPSPVPAFQFIRGIAVYAESEELPLELEPITDEICGGDEWIETDALYSGLETGRWLVVTGERSDVPGTEGVKGSELVMLDAVRQYVQKIDLSEFGESGRKTADQLSTFEPGEKLHTYLKLATPLAYCYKRSGVTINANVVKATHGDTRTETLGAGDAATPLQTFVLKQPPLTFVPANEPDGISSTLSVYVNGVEWHEAPAMLVLGTSDRGFVTRTADDGKTSVVFGNGVHGARLPTGVENISAIYRSGIGRAGNVKANQISQLLSRPLGVRGVINPQEAAGGADKDTRDQARKNAPLAVMALDRLVGTRDYADFSRTFAGISKAAAARIFVGGGDGVYVTIAGVDITPLAKSTDLYANLVAALRAYGDPSLPVRVESRELLMMVLNARIAIRPDYLWEDVVGRVRAKLLDRYSFDRQELGQSVVLSEVIALIQLQRGVQYVDVEALGAVSQLTEDGVLRAPQEIATELKAVIDNAVQKGRPDAYVPALGIRLSKGNVLPAQLAFFVATLPETLILNRIED